MTANRQAIFEVLNPGVGLSLQDFGRRGWRRFGVPPGGAMDEHAARWANVLLGNRPDAPTLEMLLHGARLRALTAIEVALTGAAANTLSGGDPRGWGTFLLNPDDELRLPPSEAGVWTYLAVPGGFVDQLWFGSVSVFPRGGLGGPIPAGTLLERRKPVPPGPQPGITRRWVHPSEQRDYLHIPPIPVWPGPQWNLFSEDARSAFFDQDWIISPSSDRTGYRLAGTSMGPATATIPSEPVLPGSLQVPPDGVPIVTMRDGPTVGGYPKLGLVDPAHLSWLAQCRPGQRARFARWHGPTRGPLPPPGSNPS